jgi:fibronectin-binding autotransporter adhesin
MATVSWTLLGNGNWNTGADWSTGAAPLTGDDVFIVPTSSAVVTYSAGTLNLNSLTTNVEATLDMTGGKLSTTNGYVLQGPVEISAGQLLLRSGAVGDLLGGTVTQTGGTISLVYNAVMQGGPLQQSGGVLNINNGAVTDLDSGTLSGLLSGNGEMIFDGGVTTLSTGFSLTLANTELVNGTIQLEEQLTDNATFIQQGGMLALNGNVLTLKGNSTLDGTITSGGTVDMTGHGILNGMELDNGVLVELGTLTNQTGNIVLGGSGGGSLTVQLGDILRITDNASILGGAGGGVLTNVGTLIKTGGNSINGTTVISANLFNTGTIDAAVGTIDIHGPSSGYTATLGGTLTGAGTVAFDSGNLLITKATPLSLAGLNRLLLTGSASMTLTTSLAYAGNWAQTGGTLVVGSPGQGAGSLTLSGLTAWDGGLLKGTGTVLSSGGLTLGGFADLEGNLTFNFESAVSQTGNINLGLDADAITIANLTAGESWALKGNASILGFNGVINNDGTFSKASGAGDSIVDSDLNNAATLSVNSGSLTLNGVGQLGGVVNGSAVLDIAGAYQFNAGLALSVGELILESPYQAGEVQATLNGDLAFGHVWAQEGGTLALNSHTLSLTGITSFEAGAIEGPGLVTTAGRTTFGVGFGLLEGARVQVNGPTEQTGNVVFSGGSTAPTLTIGAGSTYIMDPGVSIGGVNNTVVGSVIVNGTLQAGGGGGENVIAAAVVDTGTITLRYGEMSFLGPLSGSGVVNISDGATLDLGNSAATSTGITFGAGGAILDLVNPESYSGTLVGFAVGDMVELQGFTFLTANQPVVSGDDVTISETSGASVTLTFSTAQSASSLVLGQGPHGGLALIHI